MFPVLHLVQTHFDPQHIKGDNIPEPAAAPLMFFILKAANNLKNV